MKAVNERTRRKALKKAQKRSKKTIRKQIKKDKEPSLLYSLNSFIAEMRARIRAWFYIKKKNSLSLNELIRILASKENISLTMASITLISCLTSTKLPDDLKSERSTSIDKNVILSDLKEEVKRTTSTLKSMVDDREVILETDDNSIAYEEKVEVILKKYGITKEQLKTIIAIVLLEAGLDHYEECYHVICVLYNRITSRSCISTISDRMGDGKGTSLYYQAICPSQFTVYKSDDYYKLMESDLSEYAGTKAVIDMLYSEETTHDYYRFVAPRKRNTVKNPERLTSDGNYYWAEVRESDRVALEDVLPCYKNYIGEDKIFTLEIKNRL